MVTVVGAVALEIIFGGTIADVEVVFWTVAVVAVGVGIRGVVVVYAVVVGDGIRVTALVAVGDRG